MKKLIDETRLLICWFFLAAVLYITPKDHLEGKLIIKHIDAWLKDAKHYIIQLKNVKMNN